jgi:transcriptional regulator with XRE-family HTH domain
MSYGYSQRLVDANTNADNGSIGVYLGSRCIALGIPVKDVADRLGVSRATVYNWFWGSVTPSASHSDKIGKYLHALKNRKHHA